MAERVILDTPELTVYYDEGPKNPDGVPAWTSERVEPKPGTPAANERALRDKAAQALTANAAFLANATPTNVQVVAQVRTLTRECNALIRLLLGALTDVSDT